MVWSLSISTCWGHDVSVEDLVAKHMVGEALLAAHFVAAAERAGMGANDINAALREVADKSAIDEFWITDSAGHVYLTNTGIDFTFSADPTVPITSYNVCYTKLLRQIVHPDDQKRVIDNHIPVNATPIFSTDWAGQDADYKIV